MPSSDADDLKTHTSPWIPLSMVSSLPVQIVNLSVPSHSHSPARHNHYSPSLSHRTSSSTTACSYFDRWGRKVPTFGVDVNVEDGFRSACEKTITATTTISR